MCSDPDRSRPAENKSKKQTPFSPCKVGGNGLGTFWISSENSVSRARPAVRLESFLTFAQIIHMLTKMHMIHSS